MLVFSAFFFPTFDVVMARNTIFKRHHHITANIEKAKSLVATPPSFSYTILALQVLNFFNMLLVYMFLINHIIPDEVGNIYVVYLTRWC